LEEIVLKDNSDFKKTLFLCARRAMLENEMLLKGFANEVAINYSEEEIKEFNIFLTNLYDNDMFDIVMGIKSAEDYGDKYPLKFLKDIEVYSKKMKEKIKQMSIERRKILGY
jgi:antitoxin CptB